MLFAGVASRALLSENVSAINRKKKYNLMLINVFYIVVMYVYNAAVYHFRAIYFAQVTGEQELVALCAPGGYLRTDCFFRLAQTAMTASLL